MNNINMLRDEELLTFAEAAKRLPQLSGKRVHVSSLWRWARRGVKGVKLETRRLGNRFLTSLEALERFSQRLAEIDLDDFHEATHNRPGRSSSAEREREIENAERYLDKEGL